MDDPETRLISRREVLLGAGKLAGAAAVMGLIGSPAEAKAATPDGPWDHETDVVCVGSGGAGITAAVIARDRGVEVMLLEKMPILGGTTGTKSGGGAWIPNHLFLRAKGIEDKKDDCLRYMARLSYPQVYTPNGPTLGLPENAYRLLEVFYDNAWRMVDRLQEIGALRFRDGLSFADKLLPDYADHLPEDKAPKGRTIEPVGDAEGGMGSSQGLIDYERAKGAIFITQMEKWLRTHQVPVLVEHRVTRILKDGDRVVGVEAQSGGKLVRIKARRGVIFGTGGFAHNTELVFMHQPSLYGTCAAPGATGDFIPLAASAGARMGAMHLGWRTQVLLEEAFENRALGWPVFLLTGDSMILVNKYGRRVVNEKRGYNSRPLAHFVYDPTREEYPNQLLFMVFDERSLDAFGGSPPIPLDRRESRFLIQGASLDELAGNIAKRLQKIADKTGGVALSGDFTTTLKASVKRFDGYARSGKDLEFERGLHDFDREWHSAISVMRKGTKQPANTLPNITMYPFAKKGPYYAFILGAGALDTCGGPLINEQAQVMGNDNKPIAGLYGAGNCIASPSYGAYYGAGTTIGQAMTYGYLAALHAAQNPVTA